MKTRIFNKMDASSSVSEEELSAINSRPCEPLIDDVDTSILSFIDVYGQPPHIDDDDDIDEDAFDKEFGIEDDEDDGAAPADQPAASQAGPAIEPEPKPSSDDGE